MRYHAHLYRMTRTIIFLECLNSQNSFINPDPEASTIHGNGNRNGNGKNVTGEGEDTRKKKSSVNCQIRASELFCGCKGRIRTRQDKIE